MGQPLKAILEKDGRLRLVSTDEFTTSSIGVGKSVTVVIVGIAKDNDSEVIDYSSLSEEVLKEFWEDEPDIEDVWEIS